MCGKYRKFRRECKKKSFNGIARFSDDKEKEKKHKIYFTEAYEFLKQKHIVPSEDWRDIWQGEHSHAFTVAHSMNCDMMEKIHEYCMASITKGITKDIFTNGLKKHLEKVGWYGGKYDDLPDTPENKVKKEKYLNWRLGVIYRTNASTAYSAGRYRQQMRVSELRPIWVYSAVLDSRVRASHAAMDGKAFRYDDPFWDKFYPPNGWFCRCSVYSLTEDEAKRRGLEVTSSGNSWHPEVAGVDWAKFAPQEWQYNPGKEKFSPDWNKYTNLKKMGVLRTVKESWMESMKSISLTEGEWIGKINEITKEDYMIYGQEMMVTLSDTISDRLELDPRVFVKDSEIWHAIRDIKRKDKPERILTKEELKEIWKIIRSPDMIKKEKNREAFHFLRNIDEDTVIQVILSGLKNKPLSLRTAEKFLLSDLKGLETLYQRK